MASLLESFSALNGQDGGDKGKGKKKATTNGAKSTGDGKKIDTKSTLVSSTTGAPEPEMRTGLKANIEESRKTGKGTISSDFELYITPETDPRNLDRKTMQDYNNFVDWLEKKGLRGSSELDSGGYGKKLLAQYIKQTPGTSLTGDENQMKQIQNGLMQMSKFIYNEAKAGRAIIQGNPENILAGLSKADGYPGKWTTTRKFPGAKMNVIENNKKVETVTQTAPAPIPFDKNAYKQSMQELESGSKVIPTWKKQQ